MNCNFSININGHYEEFNSEEELNSFIRDNRRAIAASLLSDKIVFSKDSTKQAQVAAEILAKSKEILFTPEDHKFFYGNNEFKSVTKLIASKDERLGYYMTKPFNIDKWKANTRKIMSAKTNADGTPTYTAEQIEKTIAEKKESWNTSSLLGTSWHNIAQNFFEGKIEDISDIPKLLPETKDVPPFILTKYITLLTAFKQGLEKKFPNATYLTEVNIFDPEAKVAGIADLIVVDQNGKVHIYDYKTAQKDESEWNENKNETNRYQLGFYRQMLRRQLYDVGGTYIVPINIKEVDFTNNVIYDFSIAQPQSKMYKENDSLMHNINKIMPFTFDKTLSNVTSNTNVHQFIKSAFNYEQRKTTRGSKSVDDEYAYLVANDKYPNSKEFSYRPFNNGGIAYKISKSKSEQEIKDEIAEILKKVDANNSQLPAHIIDLVTNVREWIDRGESVGDYPWAAWSNKDSDSHIKIKNLLFKYINDPSWEVLDSDALADLNMLGFENMQTGEVDFMVLSSENLKNTPELVIKGATTVLGNLLPDRKANELGITGKVTNGDVELLKAYAFLKDNRDLFLDKKIGSIVALNLLEGNKIPNIKTQSLSILEKWYSELTKVLPPQLGINNNSWQPEQIDKTKVFIDYITGLVDDKSWREKTVGSKNVKNILLRYEDVKVDDIAEKTKLIGELANQLSNALNNQLNTVTNAEYRDTGLAIKLAAEAIFQLNKIPHNIEEDLKQWSFLIDQNAQTTSPSTFINTAMSQLVQAVTEALNNTRLNFLDVVDKKDGIREMHADLYNRTGSFVKIKALGYNLDQFDNMIEREGGKPDGKYLMRFKELTDPSLNPYEKKYIKQFMNMINGVRLEKFQSKGKDDEFIENFFQSENARDIPIMKASMLTAFKGKDFKTAFNDIFREVLNPNNIFKEDSISQQRMLSKREMFDPFDLYDLDIAARAERIDQSNPGELESDLELVLGMYMMAHSKQVEVTKKLPVINAIKTMVVMDEVFNNNPTPNLQKLQNEYIATTIFGNNMLAGESKTAAKLSKAGQEATSLFVLGLSPFAGFTELITGFFGNVSRMISGKYNEHGFTLADYTKAHAIVGGTLFDNSFSYDLVNFTDSINELYGVSDMDTKQLVHELQTTSKGLTHFKSKYAYWFNTFPGYFNRMILFMSSAIKDGVIDVDASGHITKNSAYQMIDGRLVYNEKLDKRFSLYTNNKEMPENKQTTEYKMQKALYEAIRQNLLQEPNGLKSDGTFARAYDGKQTKSLKNFADDVHGSYDAADRTNFQKTAFGRLFMQFKGWVSAKKNRYYMETAPNEARGGYVVELDDNGDAHANWKGKIMEGIWQSTMAMYDELVTNKGNIVKAWDQMKPVQKENFMSLLVDTFILGLLSLLAALFTEPNMQKDNPVGYQAVSSLRNSSHDFFIGYTVGSVTGTKNPLALASWGSKVAQDSWSVVTGGKDPSDLLKNVAVYRTVNNMVK